MKSRIPKTHRRARPSAPDVQHTADGAIVDVSDGVCVHVGDALHVLPTLRLDPLRTVAIVDPPWPEAPAELLAEWGIDDCAAFLRDLFAALSRVARRLVIIVGCSTDPRVLTVPASHPFVRVCWLRLALPSPRGTILNSGDVAYVFGSREAAADQVLLPGEVTAHTPRAREGAAASMHPTARRLEHMRWIVRHFTHPIDTVIDATCGSGTTLQAAREAGRWALGIERCGAYVPAIRERFRQTSLLGLSTEVAHANGQI